jgi:hypothetical protein
MYLPRAPNVRTLLMSRSATFVRREASMSYVSVAGGGLSDAMTTMRIRLGHRKFGPDAFKYTPDADGVVFRV